MIVATYVKLTALAEQEAKTPVFMEHSNWENLADEDLDNALKRMVVLAIDLNKEHPEKSIEEYFAERVFKVLNVQEIKLDGKYLQ